MKKLKRLWKSIPAIALAVVLAVPSYATVPVGESTENDIQESESVFESSADESEESEENTFEESEESKIENAPESEEEKESEEVKSEETTGIDDAFSTGDSSNTADAIGDPSQVMAKAKQLTENIMNAMPATYDLNQNDILSLQMYETIVVNIIRLNNGVEPLALAPYIVSEAAMVRATECRTRFDHTRPDGRSCDTALDDIDSSIYWGNIGENIAYGFMTVDDVIEGWWNSEGHRRNMLDPDFQTIGVGFDVSGYPYTWTQFFTGATGNIGVSKMQLVNMSDTYQIGTDLEQQGICVYVKYENGVEGIVPVLNEMIEGYNPNQKGKQTIKINCQGYEATVSVTLDDYVKKFVERLYTQVLGRGADPSGLEAWSNVLKNKTENGAKVAQGFIDSTEFKSRSLSDEDYIRILYRTFLDRDADASGLAAWKSVLDSGLSRLHVFKGFAESQEFTEICGRYGIERGNAELTAPRDQNEGVTKFVVRCYRLCLGRDADESGLNGWCNAILTGQNTAKQAAHGFVFSDEFKKKNLSDTEYVKTLYRVFMDREADGAGLNAWVKVLRSGKSREHVFNGFADSNEFREICARYGIK